MLEEIQSIVEKVKVDLQEGRSDEEVALFLRSALEEKTEIAEEIIEGLMGSPSVPLAHLFQRLLEHPSDKNIRKMIKRSLYRLKSKGIAVDEVLPEKEGPVLRPLQAEPPRGYGGPFDFLGQRFLMLVVPRIGRGMTVMQGIVSDTEGLIDFSGGEMPRKRFKEFFGEVQQGSPFPFIEMEPSYVGFLFVQAHQLTLVKGKTPVQEYLRLKKEIESIRKQLEKPPAYSLIPEDEIEGNDRMLSRGGDLLKNDLFGAWRLVEEEIRPYAEEVWEAEESKLILNPAQKEARFQEVYRRALSDLFPEERRSLYRRRMEEMAYYLFKSGREEEAKLSLAVALDLKKSPNLIQPNPFLFQLVIKSIFTLLKEAYEKKVREPSFIMKP